VVALALGAGLLLAPYLFVSARSYPRAPVLDAWPLLPLPLDVVVLVGLGGALVGVALAPQPRWWAAAAGGLVLILAADDQSRWQPWFFQYGLMIGGLALARDTEDALAAWRTVLIGLYFWSGVQKLNATFMTHLFPWLVEPLTSLLPGAMSRLVLAGWMVVPLTEIVVAVGLAIPRLRNAAVVGAVTTHVVVLALLGPFAHRTNAVVWPWNVAMAALAVLLFWNEGRGGLDMLVPRRLGAQAGALVLVGFMPLLSFTGHWDAYLSGALYSGNIEAAVIGLPEAAVARLPDAARRHVVRNRAGASVLDVHEWSMDELGVPPYPEDRVFRAVAREVCRRAGDPAGIVLVIFGRPSLLAGHREIARHDCLALGP
jgi:hypothetical protein